MTLVVLSVLLVVCALLVVASSWSEGRSRFLSRLDTRQPSVRVVSQGRRQPEVQRVASVRRPTNGKVTKVPRDRRPLWESRGWRREGQRLVGSYRTPRGSFLGEIALGNPPQFFILHPPKALLNGSHSACFRKRGGGKYYVHFGVESPEVDAGIVGLEKLIAKAI